MGGQRGIVVGAVSKKDAREVPKRGSADPNHHNAARQQQRACEDEARFIRVNATRSRTLASKERCDDRILSARGSSDIYICWVSLPRRHGEERPLTLRPEHEEESLVLSRTLFRAHHLKFFKDLARLLVLPSQGNKERLLLRELPFTLDYFALDTFQLITWLRC